MNGSDFPNYMVTIKGFLIENQTLVIAALMRKLGVNSIDLETLDLSAPKGVILDERHVTLHEH